MGRAESSNLTTRRKTMLTQETRNQKPLSALLVLLALSPFQLAAKGCDVATVGEDGCPEGQECSGGGKESKTCGGLAGLACGKDQYCDYTADDACGAGDATGVCKPKPEACDAIYDPVCGCDGKSYGNACSANLAGVSVAHEGLCQDPGGNGDVICGGLAGAVCGKDEYCDFPSGAACGAGDVTGVCKPAPTVCDDVHDPVCGCDGETYANACEANGKGVSVAHTGECKPGGGPKPGKACGGLTGLTCADDQYCNFPPDAACGAGDVTGLCTPTPKVCDDIYSPVCGCDGETYANACEANGKGVSVAREGECQPEGGPKPGKACGGLTGASCADNQYCDFPPDAACGAGDATGVCTARPDACDAVYDPVCGCNGKTYGNVCEAATAGVPVASEGECK
jgi:hypothetical protein